MASKRPGGREHSHCILTTLAHTDLMEFADLQHVLGRAEDRWGR